jgi:molybdopterin-guanine dinucleotide biosynthesis protein A
MPSLAAAVLRLLVEGLAGSPELDAMTLGASPEAEAPARVNSAPAPFAPIPLPMAIRPALARDTVRASLAGGRRSLRAWLATVAGGEIASSAWRAIDPTADTLADIDTREDLRRRE